MKGTKAVAVLLLMVSIFDFSGCSQCNTESVVDTTVSSFIEASDDTSTLIDETVRFENAFDISDDNSIQNVPIHGDFIKVYPNLASIYESAVNVAVGTVIDVQYTDEDAIPRTIYSFQISEVLKGDMIPNSLISVGESNGYVRLRTYIEKYGSGRFESLTEEEIENRVFLQSIAGAPIAAEGETYVVFLSERKAEGRLAGAYAVIGNFMGKYVLDSDSNLYKRFTPSTNPEFYVVDTPNSSALSPEQPMTLDEIKSIIEGIS